MAKTASPAAETIDANPGAEPYGAADATALSSSTLSEQVRLSYSQIPAIMAGPSLSAVLFVYIMRDNASYAARATWLCAVLAIMVVAVGILKILYERAEDRATRAHAWGVRYAALGVAGGAAWGSAGWFLYPADSIVYQVLLVLFMYTGAAAVMVTTVAYRPAFIATLFPILVPIAARTWWAGDALHRALALVTLFYLGTLLFLHRNIHRTLVDSLRLQFKHLDLLRAFTVQRDEARRANDAKSRFLAAASHDLRQPLHAQGLFVAELLERIKDEADRAVLLRLQASIEAANGLMHALLDISKLDAGVISPRIEHFGLRDLLGEIQGEFAAAARAKGLVLRVLSTRLVVRSDRSLVARILRNLVANAVRYTETGRILVGCRRKGDWVRVLVCDTGVGIPEGELDNIFQEFYQLGNEERDRRKGLGIGLAIVERLVRLLGCRMHVRSVPGKGSIFAFDVPRSETALIAAEGEHAISDCMDLQGTRVVVVDDDADVCAAMVGCLRRWGCEAHAFRSAEEAVRAKHAWNRGTVVLVLDYRLPGGATGTQAQQRLQEAAGRRLPSVLVTGDTGPERLREARASGLMLLHKPVSPAKLRAIVSYLAATGP